MPCDNCATILNYNKYKYRVFISNGRFNNKYIIIYRNNNSSYLKRCCVITLLTKLHTSIYSNNVLKPEVVYSNRANSAYNKYKRVFEQSNTFIINLDTEYILYNIDEFMYMFEDTFKHITHYPLRYRYEDILTNDEYKDSMKKIISMDFSKIRVVPEKNNLNHRLQIYKNKSKKHNKHKDNKINELKNKIKKLNETIEDQEYIINKLTQQIL